jgi:hypothetical protein
VKLTTHLYLVPRSRICGAIPHSPNTHSWFGAQLKQRNKLNFFIILSAVLYGCETYFLTLTEENRLRVFEYGVLKRIFGPKREEVAGG